MSSTTPITGKTRTLAILVVAALGLFAANAGKMLAEFDLPWHLAFGRQLFATWSVPRVDDLAYTHSTIRYLGVLADGGLYALMRFGGPLGLQLANGLVAVGIAATIVGNARVRRGAFHPVFVVVAAAALVAMSPWTFVRPTTFGFLLVGVELWLVGLGTRRALAMAALLPLAWANVHGSVVVGVGILALNALQRRERTATGAAALGAMLACANPAGPGIYRGGATVGAYEDILREWHATSWHFFTVESPVTGAFLAFAFAIVLAGKNADGTRRIVAFDAVLLVAAVALSTRLRFVPFAVVLLAPIAASRAAGVVRETPVLRAAFFAAACGAGPGAYVLHDASFGVGFDPTSFPVAATEFVARSRPTGNVWNFWPFGGYLAWQLYPVQRVLIDGRIGFVHERDLVYEAVASETKPDAFARLDSRFAFQWAFCRADEGGPWCEPVARSKDWRLVFVDPLAAVYVRTDGPNAALAAAGYRVLTHLTAPEEILRRALAGDADLSHDALLARAQAPTSPRAWFIDACGALAVGDRARFEDARRRLGTLAPAHPALAVLASAGAMRWGG